MGAMMRVAIPLALLLLAACNRAPAADDSKPPVDPAIADAVNYPLASDPGMIGANDPQGTTPTEEPPVLAPPFAARVDTSDLPPLNEPVFAAFAQPAFANCNRQISFAAKWSVQLPGALELGDDAQLVEAAGSDAKGCALRAVRYATHRPVADVMAAYRQIAGTAGYGVSGSGTAITANGAAGSFMVSAASTGNLTVVDVISNRGR